LHRSIHANVVDFDGVTYRARGEGDALTIFVAMHGFEQIRPHGMEKYLKAAYADGATVSMAPTTLDGAVFNMSLTVDLARDHGDGADAFATKVRYPAQTAAHPCIHAVMQCHTAIPAPCVRLLGH